MTEPDSITQARGAQEATRGKGGKGKAIIKRSKTETPSRQEDPALGHRRFENRQPDARGTEDTPDPQMIAKIQQRAYDLFEAGGREHGHELDHWLEAERQITGGAERPNR